MFVKHRRLAKNTLHICNMVLACSLVIHNITIFPHFIPQNAVEGSSCLEHASLILLTKFTANGARELVELVVVRSQLEFGVLAMVVRRDMSHSSGKHFSY